MSDGGVGISRQRRGAFGLKFGPASPRNVENMDIIQMPSPVVAAKKIHVVVDADAGRAVSCARRAAVRCLDRGPRTRNEVKFVEITPIRAVIATENEHGILINDRRVGMSW